ncbi:uncharacterized protein LOC129906898 isoform X2 [Episyrphus balteatus]|uniref:uncharacterized protein LOC129906898 isoform X2 n=1 Tax=Episyrphus balteatus TaxID=286459 RepID=UPI002485E219|nr:uncharacterized protein LOC129906898 isoform X2 [Episyrphus balteatus]
MRSCSIQVKTDPTHRKKSHNLFEKEKLILEKVSQRPTTLKLKPNTEFHLIQVKKNNLSNQHLSKNKTSNGLVSSSLSPTERKNGSCINNSTKIQSPTINSDLGKSEIFVNVSLSPSSHRSRIGGTQRHQAEIIVHPKVPFTRNFELATSSNHKSYTSLNLVLRQPSSNPQSLIDITVGPNLTYSSSSYHAPLGYQNNYQISFTNDFGVFSAFRISPFSNNGTNVATVDTGACEDTLDANSQDYYNIVKSTNACGKSDVQTIIMRQHIQKEKILTILRKNKNKLMLVHKEVDLAIQSSNGLPEILDKEINKLRFDCQTLLNEIENSKKCLRGGSNQPDNSSENSQANSFPKYKVLRYPASISSAPESNSRMNKSATTPPYIPY